MCALSFEMKIKSDDEITLSEYQIVLGFDLDCKFMMTQLILILKLYTAIVMTQCYQVTQFLKLNTRWSDPFLLEPAKIISGLRSTCRAAQIVS